MKKNRKVEKDGNDDVITIPYKIKLFDSARFMASSFHKILSTILQKKKKIIKLNAKIAIVFLNTNVSSII